MAKRTEEVCHVIVPDSHAKPGTNMRRFVALGNFIHERIAKNPRVAYKTIELGDFEDMPSLSSYDKGKLSFEGRRYNEDVAAALFARHAVYDNVNNWLIRQAERKKKVPEVEHYALGGNHFEGRINKYVQEKPELLGFITHEHAYYAEFKLIDIPFLVPIELDGIQYVHYWQCRGTGKPIGTGKSPASVLLREKHCSTVVGHSHVLDRAIQTSGNGNRLFALSAGCYLDPDEQEDYAGQSNKDWWRGITVLHDVRDGFPYGGEEYISVDRLIKEYT